LHAACRRKSRLLSSEASYAQKHFASRFGISLMRRLTILALLLVGVVPRISAQSQQRAATQQKPDPDRLGLTCAQILQMSSSDWVAKITGIDDSNADGQLRGIRVYGNCYDQRTDRLKASLAKSGKGPLMGASANFRDFDQALQKFAAKALAESESPADAVKTAYAALYEKQFRYAFYQSYEQPAAKAPSPTAAQPTAKQPVAAAPPQPKTPPQTSSVPPPTSSSTTANEAQPTAKDVDPVTLAKNHFGKLLSDLPDDKMHDLHAAFGQILVLNAVGASMQLAIYRYAIFLLEPLASQPPVSSAHSGDSNQPFAPPPF
jgi:hypothetical protein